MILTPENDKNLILTLVEFSYAEYGSALEMLRASKMVKSPNLKMGYIDHAIDEYRHTELIYQVIRNQILDNEISDLTRLQFKPLNVILKGYIDKDGFLIEKLRLKNFVEFVYSNEFLAKISFDKLKLRVNDRESLNIISGIMEEEQEHADNSIETLNDIMKDEQKHWGYAKKYYESKYPKSKLKLAFTREKIKNRLRLVYLKNFKFLSNVFDPLINLLILIFGPITSLIRVPKDTKNIIHNNYDSII